MTDAPERPRWIEFVPVEELPDDPRNPKRHSDADLDASIGRFGYTEPVMVDDRTGRLVSGHGRKAALLRRREAGEQPPAGVTVDSAGAWLVPVVRGWSSVDDAEAAAYLVAANRLTEKGGWNDRPLIALLQELQETADQALTGVGFDDDDLDTLLRLATAYDGEAGITDPYDEWRGMPDFDGEDLRPHRRLKVMFASAEDVETFARALGVALTPQTSWIWWPPRERRSFVDVQYLSAEG